MDYSFLINKKVFNKSKETGIIVEVNDDNLKVKFSNRSAYFQFDAFIKGFLILEDSKDQEKIFNIESEKANEIAMKKQEENSKLFNNKEKKSIVSIDHMFDKNFHIEYLSRKPILTYQEVEQKFNISISGFGKGINFNGECLILISTVKKRGDHFVYHDHWTTDGYYIYSGEGKTGDQKLIRGNKLIADTTNNNTDIHLFIKMSSSQYFYQGLMKLKEYAIEDDYDEDGKMRKEYKFKLQRIKN